MEIEIWKITRWETPPADKDYVISSEAPEKVLNEHQ